MKFIPDGWDEAKVKDGLYKAMGFGEPTRTEDKATFHIPEPSEDETSGNSEGVPWDPTVKRPVTRATKQVPCAIEFVDSSERTETFGAYAPTQIVITLLDDDYQQVRDFDFVVAGGDKYFRSQTEPPIAMGTIDVWTVHCTAQDER